jgi:hypothetical protein
VRQDDREQGCRGVQDRGEAGGDVGLAPDDQTERDDVVQHPHNHERPPGGGRARHAAAGGGDDEVEHERRQGDATEHDGEGPQPVQRHRV